MSGFEKALESNPTSGGGPAVSEELPEINENEVLGEEENRQEEDDDNDNDEDDDDDDDDEDDEDSDDEDSDDDDDSEEEFVESLPPVLRTRVATLKVLNEKRDQLIDDYLKERAALEAKFSKLCQPLFEERKTIVNTSNSNTMTSPGQEKEGEGEGEEKNGHVDGDDDGDEKNEVKEEGEKDKDNDDDEENGEDEDIVGIPDFWTGAMSNIEVVDELVTERDGECLSYLEDIVSEDFENGLGFTLFFHFKENPYFTNRVLTKKYSVPNLLLDDEPILKNVIGCDIDWKEEVCLTFREIVKKQRNKKGKIRHVKKQEKTDSFFHFFSPPKIPDIKDMDEEQADAIEEAFDHDYEVAQSFRKYIVPKAVLWFTGEAMQEELMTMFDGGETMIPQMSEIQQEIQSSPFPPPADGTEDPECKQS